MQTLLRDPAAGVMHSLLYFSFLILFGALFAYYRRPKTAEKETPKLSVPAPASSELANNPAKGRRLASPPDPRGAPALAFARGRREAPGVDAVGHEVHLARELRGACPQRLGGLR